jgi:hypothetical protein
MALIAPADTRRERDVRAISAEGAGRVGNRARQEPALIGVTRSGDTFLKAASVLEIYPSGGDRSIGAASPHVK